MKSRIAIVDLGTNTFHLLIADVEPKRYEVLYRQREAVKLGLKGINQNMITDDAQQRALKTLRSFKSAIDTMNVTKIFAYGTSALRNANNKSAVVASIKHETGLEINIIPGDEEARLIYLGVRSAIPLGIRKSLIIDIGGGSVEFIIGNESQIFWKESFEIGAQRLLETYHKHDPIKPDEINNLHIYLATVLGPLFDAIRFHQPEELVGSSGTFDTLSDIYCLKAGIPKEVGAPEAPLSFDGFKEIYLELVTKNREQRMAVPGMIEMRVDMIVVACCLIDYLIGHYPFKKIRVSSFALKEGVLADIMQVSK